MKINIESIPQDVLRFTDVETSCLFVSLSKADHNVYVKLNSTQCMQVDGDGSKLSLDCSTPIALVEELKVYIRK